jgi:hypothetical protein
VARWVDKLSFSFFFEIISFRETLLYECVSSLPRVVGNFFYFGFLINI